MSTQSPADSWREAFINFGLTIIIGTAIWYEVVLRLERWGWYDPFTPGGAAVTTAIYTVASVIRRYIVRRRAGCGQTRAGSWVESCVTTVLFMLAAWAVWVTVVYPMLIGPGVLDKDEHGLLINATIAACMIPPSYLIRRVAVWWASRRQQ